MLTSFRNDQVIATGVLWFHETGHKGFDWCWLLAPPEKNAPAH